jgi:hypothetical protein
MCKTTFLSSGDTKGQRLAATTGAAKVKPQEVKMQILQLHVRSNFIIFL